MKILHLSLGELQSMLNNIIHFNTLQFIHKTFVLLSDNPI